MVTESLKDTGLVNISLSGQNSCVPFGTHGESLPAVKNSTVDLPETIMPILAKRKYQTHKDDHRPVSFLTESEIYAMCDTTKINRQGPRDELLILVTFQAALRISEALALTPSCRGRVGPNYILMVKRGKGGKARLLGINQTLYDRLGSYAYENSLLPDDKYFKFTRFRALQIVKKAAKDAGIDNRRVYNHLLRHSGALTRLKKHGNIESLRQFLGHTDHTMTERYLRTLQNIESIGIEGKVQFER
jgi:integrase